MRPRIERFVCAWLCLFGVLAAAHAARAQASPEEKAAAEAIFQEGFKLIKRGNFIDACPKFEMSLRLEPGVGTMLYLAECYEKTNRTASSWAMFREAASLAEASKQTERMKTAQARAARLEARLAWCTVEISPEALVSGLAVRRNGALVPHGLSGTPTPVDPGELVIEASAPGRLPFSSKVSVAPMARVVVRIPALALAPQAAPEAAPPAPMAPVASSAAAKPAAEPVAPAAPSRPGHASVVPWVVGGVGLVGLSVGSYFGLKAISNASDARDLCPRGLCDTERGEMLARDARSFARVSNVAFALGAGAIAAGAVLYFTLPTTQPTEVGLVPLLDPSSVGLGLRGRLAL